MVGCYIYGYALTSYGFTVIQVWRDEDWDWDWDCDCDFSYRYNEMPESRFASWARFLCSI